MHLRETDPTPNSNAPAERRLFSNPLDWLLSALLFLLWLLYYAFCYLVAVVQRIFCGESPPSISPTFDFSPDGRLMVFNGLGRGDGDLYLLDVTSCKVRRLTDSDENEQYPRFSPDGKHIVYSASLPGPERNYPWHLYLYNVNDGTTEQLTFDTSRRDSCPSFSSDGTRVAFDGTTPVPDGNYPGGVYIVDVKSKECRQLIHGRNNAMLRPRFWRSDTEVLFTAYSHDEDHLGSYAASIPLSGDSPEPTPITPYGYMTSCVYPLSNDRILLIADEKGDLRYQLSIFDCRTQAFERLPEGDLVSLDPVAVGEKYYWIAGVGGIYCLDTSLGIAAVPSLAFDRSLFERPTDWFGGPPKRSRSQHPRN